MIEVEPIGEEEFSVVITEESSKSEHNVTLNENYYNKLTNGDISKEELVRRSFEFLLEREPKESILNKFDLKTINRYFPEYEDEISLE